VTAQRQVPIHLPVRGYFIKVSENVFLAEFHLAGEEGTVRTGLGGRVQNLA
jgi:hypothetical protein